MDRDEGIAQRALPNRAGLPRCPFGGSLHLDGNHGRLTENLNFGQLNGLKISQQMQPGCCQQSQAVNHYRIVNKSCFDTQQLGHQNEFWFVDATTSRPFQGVERVCSMITRAFSAAGPTGFIRK